VCVKDGEREGEIERERERETDREVARERDIYIYIWGERETS